jgi:rhodanese-related sulfurtransferase
MSNSKKGILLRNVNSPKTDFGLSSAWSVVLSASALIALAMVCARADYCLRPAALASGKPLPAEIVQVDAADAGALQALWVDARSAQAYKKSHVPGAVNLTLRDWDFQFAAFARAWRPGKAIVVYCDGGECLASREVAEKLLSALPRSQKIKIYILKGGYPEWQNKHKKPDGQADGVGGQKVGVDQQSHDTSQGGCV